MNIDTFTPQYIEEVRLFCIDDLAGIICDCVEHDEPRSEADRSAAENWIRRHGLLIRPYTEKFLILTGYEELKKEIPHLSEIERRQPYGEIDSSEVGTIEERLAFLTDEEFSQLISITPEERRRYQKSFLGRDIWNQFYEARTNCNYFSFNGYGKIKFC